MYTLVTHYWTGDLWYRNHQLLALSARPSSRLDVNYANWASRQSQVPRTTHPQVCLPSEKRWGGIEGSGCKGGEGTMISCPRWSPWSMLWVLQATYLMLILIDLDKAHTPYVSSKLEWCARWRCSLFRRFLLYSLQKVSTKKWKRERRGSGSGSGSDTGVQSGDDLSKLSCGTVHNLTSGKLERREANGESMKN